MKLTYRGVSYETQSSPLQVVQGGVMGSYRGAPWRVHTLISPPPVQPAATLTYRGVRYHLGDTEPASMAGVVVAPATIPANHGGQVSWKQRKGLNSTLEVAHRHAILNNLERRLLAARTSGDERLVRLLEAEWQQFA